MSDTPWKPWSERLKDPRWQKKSAEVKSAANWRCEDCGRGDKLLEAHHTAYIPGMDPWEYDGTLLICVCKECHKFRQDREDALRVNIGRITRCMTQQHLDKEMWLISKEMAARWTAELAAPFMTDDEE